MTLFPRLIGGDPALRLAAVVAVAVGCALLLDTATASAGAATASLACPPVLAVDVRADKHPGWSLYSNDPLRLTGADIAFVSDEDSILDPDETKQPDDRDLSVIALFHLRRHPELKDASLVCHYGEHAQLSRALPPGITECAVTRHRQFDEKTEAEFAAMCR